MTARNAVVHEDHGRDDNDGRGHDNACAAAAPKAGRYYFEFVSDFVAAVLDPLIGSADGSPIQMPILSAVLAAVREEFQRAMTRRTAPTASQYTVTQLTGPKMGRRRIPLPTCW